ncbi:sugar phosphate isomerase/epimerase family protein [Streptomyces sp. NPDC020845]|uniref:sugar phosphate isomerase/epimerase family protein n=1 Tax=Streptomyces sp. NPDC020845 TaxID=3365096 RepID=UPI0037AB4241
MTATDAPGLTLCALTLRTASFDERVRAAAQAGFTGIGLAVHQYRQARAEGWTDARMAALLTEYGLRLTEVELLRHWARPRRYDERRRSEDDTVFHIAETFGARRVNAGMFDEHPYQDLVDGLRTAAERAERAGAVLGLEFMPFSGIRDLGLAARVVAAVRSPRPAGAASPGLILDAWHLTRGRTRPEEIAALPPGAVVSVQLDDVLPTPLSDTLHEARHQRQLPGEGSADLTGLLRLLRRAGVQAPVSVEVLSDDLDARAPAETAARAYRTTCRVLATAAVATPAA